MIHSITLNPALDVSGVVDKLVPNEKCYVFDELHLPGGNGINAGIIAKRLGSPVILTGFLGGPNGQEILSLLDQERINHQFVSIKGRTRMNVTVSNKSDHLQTRLSFPGPQIELKEIKQLDHYIHKTSASDLVLFGGSLPHSINTQQVSKWIIQLKRKDIRVIVDMPGRILSDLIQARPYFIKPNLVEFQELTGKRLKTKSEVIKEAKKLLPLIPNICISSVEGGAIFLNEKECWFGKIPSVKIYSSVGAGDSMVGAIASLWLKRPKAGIKELLQLALASSCATLTEQGMNLGKKKQIHYFRPKILLKPLEL